jgi:hypothetical protein
MKNIPTTVSNYIAQLREWYLLRTMSKNNHYFQEDALLWVYFSSEDVPDDDDMYDEDVDSCARWIPSICSDFETGEDEDEDDRFLC